MGSGKKFFILRETPPRISVMIPSHGDTTISSSLFSSQHLIKRVPHETLSQVGDDDQVLFQLRAMS